MSLILHVEKYLGPIARGWKENNSKNDFQIISFHNCPEETVSTFLSLGMSDQILKMSNNKQVRQELVFSVYTIKIPNMVVSFLMSICDAIKSRGKAVLRGEVIPLSSGIAEIIGFEALYCTIPIFFSDDFHSYDATSPSTVMVWIVPLYQIEADYINKNGWESFEDMLEEKDPDLCSLERDPIF